jgi:hypothetical protein
MHVAEFNARLERRMEAKGPVEIRSPMSHAAGSSTETNRADCHFTRYDCQLPPPQASEDLICEKLRPLKKFPNIFALGQEFRPAFRPVLQ